VKQSEQINELAAALVKAQSEFSPAVKNANNPHFKSKYLDLNGAIEAAQPALLTNGIAVIQGVEGSIEGQSITVNTRLIHTSGQWIEDSLTLPALNRSNFDAQSVGSAVTYGRRYSYMAMLGFAAEDDDGNAAASAGTTAKASVQPIAKFNNQAKQSLDETYITDDDLSFLNDDRHPAEVAQQEPVRQAARPHTIGSVKAISEKQAKRLWAIAKQRNVSQDAVLRIIGAAGYDSVEAIGWKDYEKIVGEVEAA
jgi:hypothetical protein